MKDKITRVCNTFQGKIFNLPEDGQAGPQPFMRMIQELKGKVTNMRNLIDVTKNQMKDYYMKIQDIPDHPEVS